MSSTTSAIDRNSLGNRGEAILVVALLAFHGRAPLFRPAALGEKWPAADYAVELVGKPGRFFLIQVKSTRRGMQKNGRLQIRVGKARYNALASTPVPRYVVGIDDQREGAYIWAAVRRRNKQVSSLTTAHSLKLESTRSKLFREVDMFWDAVGRTHFASSAFSGK